MFEIYNKRDSPQRWLTSLRFLFYYTEIDVQGTDAMFFTGINSGAYSAGDTGVAVHISADGQLTEYSLITEEANIRSADLLKATNDYYAFIHVDVEVDLNTDAGVICKESLCKLFPIITGKTERILKK